MSTSFPQDVLRRIRALEQRLGTGSGSGSGSGGSTSTTVSATLPIIDDNGTTTAELSHPTTDFQTTVTDDSDSSYESFVNVIADHGQGFSKIDYGAQSPSTAAEIQCFASEGATAYSQTVLADSPLVYWRLGESAGSTATDASGNGRDGTYTTIGTGSFTYGVTSPITSESNTAVTVHSVDGSTTDIAYVNRAASTAFDTSNFSCEAWIKPTAGKGSDLIIGRLGSIRWKFKVKADLSALRIDNGTTTGDFAATISSSSWQHVVLTWDGTHSKAYVNGVLVGTGTVGPNTSVTNGALAAGTGSVENYDGGLDEFAVYSTALSADRVLAHYNAAFVPKLPGIGTGYFQLSNELAAGALYITNGTPSITPVADTAYAWDYANDRLFVYHSVWQPVGWADSYRSDSQSSAYTADYTAARVHRLTLTGNVTLTLSNAVSGYACGLTLYLIQDGTGSRTVTWPGSVKWPSGTAPTLSTAASSVDIVVLESTDGGTTWYGNLAGKGYA